MVEEKWHWFRTIVIIVFLLMLVIGALIFFAVLFPTISYPVDYLIGFIILLGGFLLTVVMVGDVFIYIFKIRKKG